MRTAKNEPAIANLPQCTLLGTGYVVACEQALRGALAAGREKEGENSESAHRKRIFFKPLSRVV